MSSLVIIPYVIVLVILVFATACLIYDRAVHKTEIDNLQHKLKVREAEIKSLNECIGEKLKRKKLYTFHSAGIDPIENVVNWGEYNQRLKLTLDDGSFYIFGIPSQYGLIRQNQPEKEPSV